MNITAEHFGTATVLYAQAGTGKAQRYELTNDGLVSAYPITSVQARINAGHWISRAETMATVTGSTSASHEDSGYKAVWARTEADLERYFDRAQNLAKYASETDRLALVTSAKGKLTGAEFGALRADILAGRI